MPTSAPKICRGSGCAERVKVGRYCDYCRAKVRSHAARLDTRPTANQRGYNYQWQGLRSRFLLENPECFACGEKATVADHRVALRDGGENVWENLQSLCHTCHNIKTKAEGRRDKPWGA